MSCVPIRIARLLRVRDTTVSAPTPPMRMVTGTLSSFRTSCSRSLPSHSFRLPFLTAPPALAWGDSRPGTSACLASSIPTTHSQPRMAVAVFPARSRAGGAAARRLGRTAPGRGRGSLPAASCGRIRQTRTWVPLTLHHILRMDLPSNRPRVRSTRGGSWVGWHWRGATAGGHRALDCPRCRLGCLRGQGSPGGAQARMVFASLQGIACNASNALQCLGVWLGVE